jgi:dolichol-phosphate mannosyltransferase
MEWPVMPVATLIVVPTFNEAENIERLVVAVRASLPAAHVLIVDDASPDGTAAIVRRLAAADPQVQLLERAGRLGLGSAYVAGFGWGLERGYQRFFEMDADFSHDPSYLPAFVAALDGGADLVVGSRNVAGGKVVGWGLLRHALSKGGSLYARLALNVGVRDLTTGFKAYTRRALETIHLQSVEASGYAFQIETTFRALARGLRVVELPIVFVDRRVGKSKMTARDIAAAVTGVWTMRLDEGRTRG